MKQHHRRYQRRTEPSRRGFSNSRKGFSASRRERDQLEVQKCSLHLRGLPPKASNKDVEIWLCRTAQICLKCANGDPRLFQPIRRVTRMLNKTHNSSSFHIQLRDARIKQAIVQRLQSFKDLEDKRLYDFYGDQSTMIEVLNSTVHPEIFCADST